MPYRKKQPQKPRAIIAKNKEMAESYCENCDEQQLKIKRVLVTSHKPFKEQRFRVQFECVCLNCKQTQLVWLVEMP